MPKTTSEKKLVVILGPTGTGKTRLAIKLCKRFGGEIISADSRQVYKGADIGTNKLKVKNEKLKIEKYDRYWVQEGIRIHLYDVVEPSEYFSVGHFLKLAEEALFEIVNKNKIPFLVGGTGFYIHAFLGETPYSEVKPNWKLRKKLRDVSAEELREKLKLLDPTGLESLAASDKNNPRRLIRYIELAKACGKVGEAERIFHLPYSIFHIKIGMTAPYEFLYQRADDWVERIVNNGLIEETQKLAEKYGEEIPLLQGLIYQPMVEFIKRDLNKSELKTLIKNQLHGYIRRQVAWFKRDKETCWFDVRKIGFDKEVEELIKSGHA